MTAIRLLCTLLISCEAIESLSAADVRCYECTSYTEHCREGVNDPDNMVQTSVCSSACYTRAGEHGATYRGCAAHFDTATGLQLDYIGCKNQTWNNRKLLWCLCDTPLCNKHSLSHLAQMDKLSSGSYGNIMTKKKVYHDDDYYQAKEAKRADLKSSEYLPFFHYIEEEDGTAVEKFRRFPQFEQSMKIKPPQNIYRSQHGGYHAIKTPYLFKEGKASSYLPGKDVSHNERRDSRPSVEMETLNEKIRPHTKIFEGTESTVLASQIGCSETGFYQNPRDCRQFIACLISPHTSHPIMHFMNCPAGLVFDSRQKICLPYSSTCDVRKQTLLLDDNYHDDKHPDSEDDETLEVGNNFLQSYN